MTIVTATPDVDGLGEVVDVLRSWQDDDEPFQLHPGDLGWFWRFGADATAGAVRTWRRDGRLVAVGLLDGPDLLRVALAPDVLDDVALAERLVEDVSHPGRGVLGEGAASVEAPVGALVDVHLAAAGWRADEPWAVLRRDLAAPVEDPGIRVEDVGPDRVPVWTEVLRASFDGSTSTDERWYAMAAGLPFTDARCLVAYDGPASASASLNGTAVAVVAVWSAGPGRPGLIEPMGVHPGHRGHGYGRAITTAAASALRGLGASSAVVATPRSLVAAVATYESAGFRRLPDRRDRRRDDGARNT